MRAGAYLNDTTITPVAERDGWRDAETALELARRTGVDAPIAEHVDAVVAGRMTAQDLVSAFTSRDPKAETD